MGNGYGWCVSCANAGKLCDGCVRVEGSTPTNFADPYLKSREVDPNGIDAHAPGAKLDAGKLRPHLVLGGFANALEQVVKVGTDGAAKYSDNGWKEVKGSTDRYMDALGRHLLALQKGETHDQLSGSLHLAHVAWNALAVLELDHMEGLRRVAIKNLLEKEMAKGGGIIELAPASCEKCAVAGAQGSDERLKFLYKDVDVEGLRVTDAAQ